MISEVFSRLLLKDLRSFFLVFCSRTSEVSFSSSAQGSQKFLSRLLLKDLRKFLSRLLLKDLSSFSRLLKDIRSFKDLRSFFLVFCSRTSEVSFSSSAQGPQKFLSRLLLKDLRSFFLVFCSRISEVSFSSSAQVPQKFLSRLLLKDLRSFFLVFCSRTSEVFFLEQKTRKKLLRYLSRRRERNFCEP